jgi:cytochrome b6-f complex iron-sulfur subunit
VDSPSTARAGGTEPTRRSFLDLLLGMTVLSTLASVLYPVLRYLKPLPAAGPGGPVRLTRAEVDALETKRFVIVPAAGTRILLFRDQTHALRALDARCTHEGCTVQYVAAEAVIWCACHNARFDVEGRVLAGPPPRPLPRYAVREDDEGNVLITTERT